MLRTFLRRLAPGASALALGLTSALAVAQDGSPPGPPVNRPNTNQDTPANNRKIPAAGNTPKTTSDILPGVPATARDPAPPGTRGVRVDVPVNGAPGAAGAAAAPGRVARRPAVQGRVYTAEGVVTRIDRAGHKVNGELERFAFDPNQDWYSYVTRGAQGVMDREEGKATNRAEQRREEKAQQQANDNAETNLNGDNKPGVMEMVITKRTYTYTHARSEDGVDLYSGATMASPDTNTSRSGLTHRTAPPGAGALTTPPAAGAAPAASTVPVAPGSGGGLGGAPTNFTNIREGSYVAVRYRKVGDVNEVLNLTLIDLPLAPTGVEPGPAGGPLGAPGAGASGAAAAGTIPAAERTGTGAPRTPVVPREPVGGALPR